MPCHVLTLGKNRPCASHISPVHRQGLNHYGFRSDGKPVPDGRQQDVPRMEKTVYTKIRPYTTKDGSAVRELMHPDIHGNANQSLAEAVVPVGVQTALHCHRKSEEIYHFIEGRGKMRLGFDEFDVEPGDTVCIAPNTPHNIRNTGNVPLRLLCCSAPPYSHEDTELVAQVER